MPVSVRIAIAVVGFLMIIGAEFAQRVSDKNAMTPGITRMQTLNADARVFGLRLFGALLIFIGLVSFVLANHMPQSTSLGLS